MTDAFYSSCVLLSSLTMLAVAVLQWRLSNRILEAASRNRSAAVPAKLRTDFTLPYQVAASAHRAAKKAGSWR